jgi:hypothetical protein
MGIEISPTVHNAIQVAVTAIPGAIATGLLSSGGNGYMASALIISSILSAVSQTLHFSTATNNIIRGLPAIVAAVQSIANNGAENKDAK